MSTKDVGPLAVLNPVAVAGTAAAGGDIYFQRRGLKEQRKARKAQQRMEEFRASKQKRQQVRAAIRERAEVENQAVQTGTSGSSGVAGGVAGIQGQTASNIFSINTQRAFGENISRAMDNAASFSAKANTATALKQTAMTIFSGYNPGAGGSPSIGGGVGRDF